MSAVYCPYCDVGVEICHDDGAGYAEGETHSQTCWHCDKTFVFTTYISFSYEASKADCLNGAEHTYKRTSTFPRQYARMQCTACDHERPCTAEELAVIA